MRRLMRGRLDEERRRDGAAWLAELGSGPVAEATASANTQHYEVPTRLFELCLGEQLKYSCGYWGEGAGNLDDAERQMLELTVERAELGGAGSILELGCGWGSLSLWMARRFPDARIVSVSNSATQKAHIDTRAAALGLRNLEVVTADMRDFEPGESFDRVVSVEMFEHMRNYRELLRRIGRWLNADGKLFVHLFCHREYSYPFDDRGGRDWMARHFFTGGIMPAYDTLEHFDEDLQIEQRWAVNGRHYRRTANAWLDNLDRRRGEALAVLGEAANAPAGVALQRWRMFYMACAELFGLNDGGEWFVGHYRLRQRRPDTD
ncbi:MAG: cyclopropane-fatty-acyl-phospholipid synthase family protein [Pseudomonadota bacterium]